MTIPIFALIDCNNFYVSCERVFNPKLQNKPLAILSNNDGCFISRSNEVKELGIPMGAPYFQYQELCRANHVTVLSSNYRLYGDMSKRIMQTLKDLVPNVEMYSIDEAFLRLDDLGDIAKFEAQDLVVFCQKIRQTILQDIGIPVSIGIGYSKTFAKVANYYAKKNGLGIFDIRDKDIEESIIARFNIKDIWGIGRGLVARLNTLSIQTAKELKEADPKQIRQLFGVVLEKIHRELNNIPCHDLEIIPKPKNNIIIARSFGKPLTDLDKIEEALSNYASTACAKMRVQDSKLQGICVFIVTNYHSKTQPFYKNSTSFYFDTPTDNTIEVIKYAKNCLSKIYKANYSYKKVGIVLLNLISKEYKQQSFFVIESKQTKATGLMKVLDYINDKMGKHSIFLASQGVNRDWQAKASNKSPNYIGDWNQLIKAV